ncbi:unnamed protein product [Acanthoscelides obtectus]|uniref:Uncharacterized protein n=1 Tax=Acanthoscelides obtectus TaxID=200917 RepID=A0A9P0LFT3_ACAOB|nr:unnamed protein product [Acanthoscelides obtectus]CAK1634060.1 hypothetical protein AOBTE_LOCUS8572 [Acanthoscelides obtectus]
MDDSYLQHDNAPAHRAKACTEYLTTISGNSGGCSGRFFGADHSPCAARVRIPSQEKFFSWLWML